MPRGLYGSWEQWADRVAAWGQTAVAIDDKIIPDVDDPWMLIHREHHSLWLGRVHTTRDDIARAVRDRLADA